MKYLLSSLLVVVGCVYNVAAIGWDRNTTLDDYVNFDDGFFYWEITGEVRYNTARVTVYTINMTSQKWQDETFVDHPVWYHSMGVAVPDDLLYPQASFIWVGEQRNDWDDPETEGNFSFYNLAIADIANATQSYGAYVLQIPNQPLKFTNHPDPTDRISEDDLIGWSWRSYLNDEAPHRDSVPMRCPMTKAAKRGLDTVAEFALSEFGHVVDSFIPLGASKRGWTVWSLAAVDRRVKLAIPVVFSMLNMPVTMMNHYRALEGQWTFAFEPYWGVNLTAELHSPETQQLFMIEDMYNYKERLTMPKVLIVATGDEFFFAQDLHAWWNEMPDPKYVFYVENTEHILFPEYQEVFSTVVGVTLWYLQGDPFPSLTWTKSFESGGATLEVHADPPPSNWTGMRAQTLANDTRRDFRLFAGYPDVAFHPVIWLPFDYETIDEGHYRIQFSDVVDEWVGFFMFGWWPAPKGTQVFFSTEVVITPDTFPIAPCTVDPECYGNLI